MAPGHETSSRPCPVLTNRHPGAARILPALRRFVAELPSLFELGRGWFEVTLVGEEEIERLNRKFRGKKGPTDVLSFPWRSAVEEAHRTPRELRLFLGDIVISVETARKHAAQADHPLTIEIRQLILHGLLHLLGYDHETDQGEMAALEMAWRRRLKIAPPEREESLLPKLR